jgi:hypothetical protein
VYGVIEYGICQLIVQLSGRILRWIPQRFGTRASASIADRWITPRQRTRNGVSSSSAGVRGSSRFVLDVTASFLTELSSKTILKLPKPWKPFFASFDVVGLEVGGKSGPKPNSIIGCDLFAGQQIVYFADAGDKTQLPVIKFDPHPRPAD